MTATVQKRISGLRAKRAGQGFESLFDASCRRVGVTCTRIPDGCRQVGQYKLLRVKTPFDFVISFAGRSAMIDTKTVSGTTFANSAIDSSQISAMAKHCSSGVTAGYVIFFRGNGKVAFISATALSNLIDVRGSICAETPTADQLGDISKCDPRLIFGNYLQQP